MTTPSPAGHLIPSFEWRCNYGRTKGNVRGGRVSGGTQLFASVKIKGMHAGKLRVALRQYKAKDENVLLL